MQVGERNTDTVSNQVYVEYLRAGKGYSIQPLLMRSLNLMQGARVTSSYWLVYWQEKYVSFIILPHIPYTQPFRRKRAFGNGFYVVIYAGWPPKWSRSP